MHGLINRQNGAALLSVFVCSTLAWVLLGAPSSGIDDADIFLVYARNFIEGHGLVYNVGSEQIEGFPSLLWMGICSFFLMMGGAVEVPLFLLNLLFGITTVYACLKRCNQKPAFLVLLCAAPAWFAWCQIALVESGLWCLLLTLAIFAVSEQRIVQSAVLLPLLALTRPESMLWGCWLILVLFMGIGLERGWRDGVRAVFRPVFTYGIVWAALLLFRGYSFGNLLPGNSNAKAAHGLQISIWRGVFDLLGYLFSNPVVLLVVLVFSWVCIREIVRKRGLSRPLAVGFCLLPGLGVPLLMEEEGFRAFRFYQPIWPLLCLVSAWAMPLLYNRLNRLSLRLIPVALLATGWLIFALSPNLRHEFRMAHESRDRGAVLARMFEGHTPLPSIAASAAGGCKYAYSGDVYDLSALTDMNMDHMDLEEGRAKDQSPLNREVSHEWHPDILIESDSKVSDGSELKGLESVPRFRQHYIKGELWHNDEIFVAYFSRRFIDGLQDGYYAFQQDLQYALGMEDEHDSSVAWPGEALTQRKSDVQRNTGALYHQFSSLFEVETQGRVSGGVASGLNN